MKENKVPGESQQEHTTCADGKSDFVRHMAVIVYVWSRLSQDFIVCHLALGWGAKQLIKGRN